MFLKYLLSPHNKLRNLSHRWLTQTMQKRIVFLQELTQLFSWGDDQAMTEHATLMAKCAEVLVCPKSRT